MYLSELKVLTILFLYFTFYQTSISNSIHFFAAALLQAISWIAIAIIPEISIATLTIFLLLSNLGASIAEVANDAIVAEAGKLTRGSSAANLQSFGWMSGSSAGVLGNLLGGFVINRLSPTTIFLFFGLILVLQFFITVSVPESSLNLPKIPSNSSKSSSIQKQLSEISLALRKPEISRSIAWFSASYAMVPALTGTMFFYQTQHLNLDSSVIGLSKVFGQAAILVWSFAYNKWFKITPARKLLSALQVTMAVFALSDVLFVKGIYRGMGVPDSVYVVIFSGLLEVLFIFKLLPFSVFLARVCPAGCEGSVMAFLTSAMALSTIVSGYLGVAVAALVGVSGGDFSGLAIGLVIQAVCTALPLCWISWVPLGDERTEKKEE